MRPYIYRTMDDLLTFYLPVFTATYLAYIFIKKRKEKGNYSVVIQIILNIALYLVLLILILELIYWFILPAYNYAN